MTRNGTTLCKGKNDRRQRRPSAGAGSEMSRRLRNMIDTASTA